MNKTPFTVTLYLRGDNLDPQSVTKYLGISPTEMQRNGEERYGRQGRRYVNQIGLWALRAFTDSSLLKEHIKEITSQFGERHIKLTGISGVEEAFIDVYLCYKRFDASDMFEFEVENENIAAMNRLGLSLQISVSSFEEGE